MNCYGKFKINEGSWLLMSRMSNTVSVIWNKLVYLEIQTLKLTNMRNKIMRKPTTPTTVKQMNMALTIPYQCMMIG